MLISEVALRRIKEIIDRGYKSLTLSVLGHKAFSPAELAAMQILGLKTDSPSSFLAMVFYHNYLNNPNSGIKTIADMVLQQGKPGVIPQGISALLVEALGGQMKNYVDKLQQDIATRVLGMIRDTGIKSALEQAGGLDADVVRKMFVNKTSVDNLKRQLRDLSGEGNRNWQRIVITEMSNTIGAGSVQQIMDMNKGKKPEEIYCYRRTVSDEVTCASCRKFYGHKGIPKIYRLSTLLQNGSNYGKKQADWRPVISSTHPNSRTSQVLELRQNWGFTADGTSTFIGPKEWPGWLAANLVG